MFICCYTFHTLKLTQSLEMSNACTLSTDCNVTKVTIDDVSADNNTLTVKFSSDPNAKFRSRLNNQRFMNCECVINVICINDKCMGV